MVPIDMAGSSIVAAATFLAALLFILFKLNGRSSSRSKLPPSPRGLPAIGHLHLLSKPVHQSLLNLAQRYGGFMQLNLGSLPVIVVSTAEYAKEVLKKNDEVFASRPLAQAAMMFGGNLAWAPYGEHYKSMRKLWKLEVFTSKRLEAFRAVRKLETEVLRSNILKACKNKEALELNALLKDCTFNTVARLLMSTSYSCGDTIAKQGAKDFKDNMLQLIEAVTKINIGDMFPSLGWLDWPLKFKARRLVVRLHEYIETMIEQHKNNDMPCKELKDSIDVMLENGLDNKTIKGQIMDMTAAGMDSSATVVEWALAELLKHPQAMQQAQQELDEIVGKRRTLEEEDIPNLKYLQAVVKETLRLHPPAPLMVPHESTRACTIGEYTLPTKTRVLINVYAIARDPLVWENPHHFDPQRFLQGHGAFVDLKGQNFELLPFGSGRRMCPGMTLGLSMVQILLGTLIQGFNWQRADGGPNEELDLTEDFRIVTPLKSPLVLIPSSCD